MRKKRVKKKIFILLLLILIIIGGTGYRIYQDKVKDEALKQEKQLIQTITSHYSNTVMSNKDASIYEDNSGKIKIGTVYNDVYLMLDDLIIDKNTKYFYSTDLKGYIYYEDVTPVDSQDSYSERYKSYIPFNKSIVTKDEFTLYSDDHQVYSFNSSQTFPIIINNDDGKYYIEYNNRFLYVVSDDIDKIIDVNNTSSKNTSSVTTLCYHRVYDTDEKCNDSYICKKKSSFDKEMKYLKDNNYLTLTMQEMYWYLTKKVQLPKSVLVTFDDGYLVASAIEVLEKYDLTGTVFVITSRFKDFESFNSKALEIHSHTHELHSANVCSSGNQGGGILCLSESKVLNDLKTSRDLLNQPMALAYPFYDYNTRAISLVQKAGFKMAFIGASGVKGKAKPGVNIYKIPRMTIWDNTSFTTWKGYL